MKRLQGKHFRVRRMRGAYWIGIDQSFPMDAWVIGFVFIYFIIYKDTWWAAKYRWAHRQDRKNGAQ